MKLKILLMPIAVIISLVLIIWHIYPAWFGSDSGSIKSAKDEIKKWEDDINNIKAKKDNISKLSQSLNANQELGALVNKYYPTYQNDEDVVNNINNAAFSEGIFLLDMKVEYKKMETADDPVRVMALPMEEIVPSINSEEALAAGNIAETPIVDEAGASLEDLAKGKMKFIEATLEVYGNYEQIKKFAISLNKVGLLNNIKSFRIYKKEIQEAEGTGDKPADVLSADIVAGFGYLSSSKDDVNKLLNKSLFSKNEFNFSDIENKKDILTGSYKQSEIGETGAVNPFIKEATANPEQ